MDVAHFVVYYEMKTNHISLNMNYDLSDGTKHVVLINAKYAKQQLCPPFLLRCSNSEEQPGR